MPHEYTDVERGPMKTIFYAVLLIAVFAFLAIVSLLPGERA